MFSKIVWSVKLEITVHYLTSCEKKEMHEISCNIINILIDFLLPSAWVEAFQDSRSDASTMAWLASVLKFLHKNIKVNGQVELSMGESVFLIHKPTEGLRTLLI